ncbi:glycosyltransferase [Micromonospora sp. C28SCA-DRY-2]|uniref:glycosyltransferase n=1 Tax=Micromonospora sp. C28SCA-DRY-2 TaxID=3059522 RepID=UPI002674487E|nr:glycosyltransferase [Micromonospora sp. C28SCA-DRY-2]MDO3705944.1 glycosyltransferase [Micromonospora sp. C28SCA-DRY-2]
MPGAPPRLLVVSYHFPPAETVGARRPGALAAFALDQGWDVRVLTAIGAEQGGTPVGIPEGLVVRALPAPQLPRVNRTSGPRRDGGAGTPGRARLAGARAAAGRLIWKAGMELLIPDPQVNWIRAATRGFLRRHGGWRPDVILASGPPFSGFVVAAALARRFGVPWVADYRDLWSVGNEYWVRSGLRRAVDRRLEGRVLRSVATCVTVSEPLAETVRRTFGVDTHVVMNGIDRRPVPAPAPVGAVAADRSGEGRPGAVLTLAHTGYVYPGRRDPGPLLDAIALLGPDAARVHVVFAGEDNGIVRAAVDRAGVGDSVTLLGHVSAEKSWRIQAEADALVLLMWNDPRDAGTVTGKIFDYLLARRPILLLGYEAGVAAKLLRDRGAGVVRNDKHAIADQLREWLAVKERHGQLPAVPASALDGLFREDQLTGYLDLLRRVADGGAPGRRARVGRRS